MGRLTGLDALRGIAAICVLFGHLREYDPAIPSFSGYLAVDFFFILSGFVLARTYEHRMAESPAAFLKARIRRLWPVVALAGLICVPIAYLKFAPWAEELILKNFFLIPSPAIKYLFPLNVAAWSILFELLANVLHAFVLWRVRTPLLMGCVAAFGAIFALSVYQFGNANLGSGFDTFQGAIPRLLFAYCLGIVLWRMMGDKPPLRIPTSVTIIALPLACWLTWSWYSDLAIALLLCPLLLIGGLQLKGGRWAVALGAVSYPLYLFQMPVLDLVRLLGGPLVLGLFALAMAMLPFALIRMILKGQPRPIRVPSRSNKNRS